MFKTPAMEAPPEVSTAICVMPSSRDSTSSSMVVIFMAFPSSVRSTA